MKTSKKLWVIGHQIRPHQVTGDYDLIEGVTQPGVPGPPPHLHKERDEFFLVLEGEMIFETDRGKHYLKAGDSIDLPRGCMHTFSNPGKTPCKWLNVHSPKGFWAFFETFGIPVEEPGSMERSVEKEMIQQVVRECAQFDMHLARMPQKA